MSLHYGDGSYVGGCGAQIGGVIGIAAMFGLQSLGLGIGWSILIVCIAAIAIMALYNHIKDKDKD